MMRDEEAKAVFDTLVDIKVGSGERVLFWKHRWIHGAAAADIAPLLVALVPARTANRCTVCQALDDASWTQDFEANTSFTTLTQLMHLVHAINTVPRDPDQPDSFTWPLTTSGSYSAKSVYQYLCSELTRSPTASCTWRSWAPLKCKLFVWLAL